ncbi:olfactory receptor 14I1-like [Petaurus breviceps papuanus]|uniref:olfactory receptor 14I1-like n=1 Tax=Petaurus breviceps papuanus TaxID=3040969 RepID=UPI0036D8CFF8
MANFTVITEFLLMEYSDIWEMQVLHAVLFLMIYLTTLMGNLLTITAIATDPHLHSPMYLFLSNLSLLDVGFISVTLPKFVVYSLTGIRSISVLGCMAQVFLFIFFGSTEVALLITMSYDRFVAICHPLHYGMTMTPARCLWATVGSWLSGLMYAIIHTGNMFRLPFSGSNEIHQYFCDIPDVLKVASSDVLNTEFILLVAGSGFSLFCLAFLFVSYGRIFSSVFKIPSVEGRYKALSTCAPQLIIFLLFLLSAIFAALKPPSDSIIPNLFVAISYTIIPPFINPIIYSLRNQRIKIALSRMIKQIFLPKKKMSILE